MTVDNTENDASVALALSLNYSDEPQLLETHDYTLEPHLESTTTINAAIHPTPHLIRATEVMLEVVVPDEKIEDAVPATVVPLAEAQPAPRSLGIGEFPVGYETRNDRYELLEQLVSKYAREGAHLRADLMSKKAEDFVDGKIEVLFTT